MKKLFLCLFLALLGGLAFLLREKLDYRAHMEPLRQAPEHIVSLSPGITETLYALGLGDRIAGVTRFCNWPPEAAQKSRVGGFREINLEAIARVRPDLVVLPEDMGHFASRIKALGIPVFNFDGRTLKGYVRDLQRLGNFCDVGEEGMQVLKDFQLALESGKGGDGESRPSVLFAILNPEDCARPITEISIIGKDAFYNELIEAAGGKNAYTGLAPYPSLSREAILALDPDIIIVTAPHWADPQGLRKKWEKIGKLSALAPGRLLILTDPGDSIPGPRSIHTLNKMREAISSFVKSGKEAKVG